MYPIYSFIEVVIWVVMGSIGDDDGAGSNDGYETSNSNDSPDMGSDSSKEDTTDNSQPGTPSIVEGESLRNQASIQRSQHQSTPANKDWLRGLEGPNLETMDVDAWNVTTEPKYLTQYLSPNTTINLSHHARKIRDDDVFCDWIHVSAGGCLIRMPPNRNYKPALLDYLRREFNVITHISTHPLILNTGSPVVTVQMMQNALIAVEVPIIRLNSYGMKCPLPLVHGNMGSEAPLADPSILELNTFDVGYTYKCDKIVLANLTRRTLVLDGYPMLLALGRGYGTISIQPFKSPILRVKGYPGLVHALKATSCKNMKNTPKYTKAWRTRLTELRRKHGILDANDHQDLCGFRFEATVKAKTLEEAKIIVLTSGYLKFEHYLTPHPEPHVDDRLQFLSVDPVEYLEYVEEILKKVESTKISQRNVSNIPVSKSQRQKIIDLQNAIGWNLGKYCRPTRWDHPSPWWQQCEGDLETGNKNLDLENVGNGPYWIGGPETDNLSPMDLWELRPLRTVPCPDCLRDPERIIPEKKKSMPYPYGSMVKGGGSRRLTLTCNNKKNCSYSVKTEAQAGSLLREWIISLKFRLLPKENRREGRGFRSNWHGPSPTPEPWDRPPLTSRSMAQPTSTAKEDSRPTRSQTQLEGESTEQEKQEDSRPMTRSRAKLAMQSTKQEKKDTNPAIQLEAERRLEDSLQRVPRVIVPVLKKEFITHYRPPVPSRKETIYGFSKTKPPTPPVTKKQPCSILKQLANTKNLQLAALEKKTVSINPIDQVRLFEDKTAIRESLLKTVSEDLRAILPPTKKRRRNRGHPIELYTSTLGNSKIAEQNRGRQIAVHTSTLGNSETTRSAIWKQPWSKFMDKLKTLESSNHTIKALPRMDIPSRQPIGLGDGWRLSHGFITPDGSCLFRAISFWHFGDQNQAKKIRLSCHKELKSNRHKYWTDRGPWDKFLQITLSGPSSPDDVDAWGGEDHLAPIANALGVVLVVLNPVEQGLCLSYGGVDGLGPHNTYFLCLVNANHYEILFNSKIHQQTAPLTPPLSANLLEISQMTIREIGRILNTVTLEESVRKSSSSYVNEVDQSTKTLGGSSNQDIAKFFEEAWRPINEGLTQILKDPRIKITCLSLVPIPHVFPDGLMEGWAISEGFISTSPEDSFFRAVSYWRHGTQDFFDEVKKQCLKELVNGHEEYSPVLDLRSKWPSFIIETMKNIIPISEVHLQAMANAQRVVIWAARYNSHGKIEYTVVAPKGICEDSFDIIFLIVDWTTQCWEIVFNPQIHQLVKSSDYPVNEIEKSSKASDFWEPINIELQMVEKSDRYKLLPLLGGGIASYSRPTGLERGWNISLELITRGSNSFYRSLSYWLNGNQENHQRIKIACLDELSKNYNIYWDCTGGLPWDQFIFLSNEENIQITRTHMQAVAQALEIGLYVAEIDESATEMIQVLPECFSKASLDIIFLIFDTRSNHFEILFNEAIHCSNSKETVLTGITEKNTGNKGSMKETGNLSSNPQKQKTLGSEANHSRKTLDPTKEDLNSKQKNADSAEERIKSKSTEVVKKEVLCELNDTPTSDPRPYLPLMVNSQFNSLSRPTTRTFPPSSDLHHCIVWSKVNSWLQLDTEPFHFNKKLPNFYDLAMFKLPLVSLAKEWHLMFDYIVQDDHNIWRVVAAWHYGDQSRWLDLKEEVWKTRGGKPAYVMGSVDLLRLIGDVLRVHIILVDLRPGNVQIRELVPRFAKKFDENDGLWAKDTRQYEVIRGEVCRISGRRPQHFWNFDTYFIYQQADRFDILFHNKHNPSSHH